MQIAQEYGYLDAFRLKWIMERIQSGEFSSEDKDAVGCSWNNAWSLSAIPTTLESHVTWLSSLVTCDSNAS
jgi:hypothetical protein